MFCIEEDTNIASKSGWLVIAKIKQFIRDIHRYAHDTPHAIRTFFFHADFSASAQSTTLTPTPHPHVHLAVASIFTCVVGAACNAPTEKACKR